MYEVRRFCKNCGEVNELAIGVRGLHGDHMIGREYITAVARGVGADRRNQKVACRRFHNGPAPISSNGKGFSGSNQSRGTPAIP